MLAIVIAAALVPNVGAVPATSSCSYGQCPSSTGIATWEIASIGAILVLGLLVGLFVVMRRRRRPPAEGMAAAGPAAGGAPPSGAMQEGPEAPAPEEIAAPEYVETPEDVGTPPPTLAAPSAAAGPSSESEPDIDSLMAELDKISGEILQRTPKKGTSAPPDEESEDDASN